jgi:hypothetical protein
MEFMGASYPAEHVSGRRATAPPTMATHTAVESFRDIDPAIERFEFKVTVFPSEEPKVQAELRRARLTPVRRRVYFYDTPELALFAKDLVLRARQTDGEDDDSTVKLRPLDVPVPAPWKAAGARIELDVVGSRQVPSGKLDGKPTSGLIDQVARGEEKPSTLFDGAQRALVTGGLTNLVVLGPVDARVWDVPKQAFPHKLSVEEWSLPDGSHFMELSFKVKPKKAEEAQRDFHAFLTRLAIGYDGDPEPKTPKVLRFFAERLD